MSGCRPQTRVLLSANHQSLTEDMAHHILSLLIELRRNATTNCAGLKCFWVMDQTFEKIHQSSSGCYCCGTIYHRDPWKARFLSALLLPQLLTTTAPRSKIFFGGKMPTFPPMIYVDYISRFFNLFFSLSSESCLERWILDCFVCLFPPNPPPLQRKKRPTKRRKRQWLMVRFTLLAVVKVTIFDKCNFWDTQLGSQILKIT